MVKDRRDVTRRRQERTRRHSAAVLNRYKVDQGCVDCGFNAWPEALHFDHIDPATKRTDLGWRKDRSKLTSFAKLARYLDHVDRYCEVRCANCHAHRTSEEQHWLPSGPDSGPDAVLNGWGWHLAPPPGRHQHREGIGLPAVYGT